MAHYFLLYFAGVRGNVRSALFYLAAQGWQNVDSMAGSLGSLPGSGSQEEACPGDRTPIVRVKQRGERQAKSQRGTEERESKRERERPNGSVIPLL